MAIGRLNRSEVLTSGRRTPEVVAGTRTATMISVSGPTRPPRATAAMAVTVAATSLVSGLSRW